MDQEFDYIDYNPSETGVIDDFRSKEEKLKDFRVEEISTDIKDDFHPKEKTLEEIKFYGLRDQGRTGTCVAQSAAKMMGIELKYKTGDFAELSASYVYQQRSNRPSHGMTMADILDLSVKKGFPFEVNMESQNLSSYESVDLVPELGYVKDVAGLFRVDTYLYLPELFQSIARAVEYTSPVMIFIFANRAEYQIKPNIRDAHLTVRKADIRHAITCVDTVRYKGEDYIVVDDSWGVINSTVNDEFEEGLRKRGQRILSRNFVNKRVYSAACFDTFQFIWDCPQKVVVSFSIDKNLKYGDYDDQVAELQDMLAYEGFFPSNVQRSGYYLSITARAVLNWQKHHNVAPKGYLDSLAGHYFGPASRRKMEEIYG